MATHPFSSQDVRANHGDLACDGDTPTVTLGEAADMLGITQAAVLLRVFRRLLPSHVHRDGSRRVPRDALDKSTAVEAPRHLPHDLALLTAALTAYPTEISDVRDRIAALESRWPASPAPPTAELDALAASLANARARIAALESTRRPSRLRWRWP